LLPGGNFFLCRKTGCTLRMEICLRRQDIATEERDSFGDPLLSYMDCLDCEQGRKNRKSMAEGLKMVKTAEKEGEQNTRICEECGKEKTITKAHRLGARCMAQRTNAKRGSAPAQSRPTDATGRSQDEKRGPGPTLHPPGGEKIDPEAKTRVEIDFAKHPDLLSHIEKLSEEEVRPRDHQILYMLKRYIRSIEAEKQS
jgi:hypothetical protein